VIAALLAALLLLAAEAPAPPAPPMTDEEVVRRVLAGEAVEAILADVRTRPASFDVSEEMLAEMRRAGVPEALLAAMTARAAEAPAVEEPAPAAPTAALRLRTESPDFTVPRLLGPQLVAELELPAGALEADAAALAVLCTTERGQHPREAALRWPEGRIPERLKKARLLVFRPAVESGRSGKSLRVDLGPEVTVPLAADVSHDVLVALLARAGGVWVVLGGDEIHGVRPAAAAPALADLTIKRVSGPIVRVAVRRPEDGGLPELLRDGLGFAKDAARGARGVAFSPDGRKRVRLTPEGGSIDIEGREVPGVRTPAAPEVEVLWSSDARVVALTRTTPDGTAVDLFRIEVDEAVHALPLPGDLPAQVAALAFPEEGARVLLVGRREGQLVGWLLRTADGSVAARYTELEVRARWKDRLGKRLR
jgi:hypothetical protein